MSPDKALFDNIYSFTIFNDEIIISDNDRLRKYNNITNKVTTIAGGGYSNNYIENTDATKTRLSAKRANIRYNYNHETQELYISIASDEYVGIIKTNNTGNLFEKTSITSNSYGYEGPFHIDTNGDMYFVPPDAGNCLMFYQNSTNQINWLFCDDDFSYGNIYSIVMGENHRLYYAISDLYYKFGFIKQFLFEEYRIVVIVGCFCDYYGDDSRGLQTGICPLGLQYDFNSKVFYFTDIIGDTNIIRKYDPQTDKVLTLAGYNGYNSVDDGVSTSIVKINYPRDVVYYNGEIYFSDNDSRHGSRIRKITKDGLVYTVVGSYSVDYVGMEAPDINCMAMVGAIYKNNYYFIDSARNDGSLNYLTIVELDNDRCAISMIVNGSNIYYIETSFSPNSINSTIVKLGIDGNKKQIVAGEGNSDNDYILAKDTKLYGPTSLVMTLREEIMFVEPSKNRIRKIKKDGKVLTLNMTGNELHNPNWIGLYDNNLLLTNQVEFYVSDITLRCYGIKVTNSSVCGGKGLCSDDDKCDCFEGYFGKECTIPQCNGILSNETGVCSGHGDCLAYNQCWKDVYGLQCDFIPEIKYSTKVSKYSTILFTTSIKSFNLNNNNFSYKWSQISGTNTLDLSTISIAGTDKIDFGIKANDNNLIQGETYGLQLNITRSEIINGQLTVVSLPISFTINKSPIINNYNLLDASTNNPIQSSVVAGETNIKAIITNAQDAEGKAIEYAFGYFTSTNERVYLSYFSQSKNSATFKLPLFTSGKAKVFLTIRDELLDTDEKIVELTVTDPTANLNDNQLNNYIQNLVNNNTNGNSGNIPIEQLDIATSLLNKPVSNPNDPKIKQQREELRNTIVNSLVASSSSQNDTSTVLNILSSVTQNTQELKLETAITALQLTLNITNNNNQQQQDKIVALTSQLINSVLTTSSTNMQVCEIIKSILDSISKSIVQSLISGQSQLIQTNNIKTYLVKDNTVDSLAKSLNTTVISQLGISNLNLPIDALKTLFKNNGIDITNPVALGVNVVPNSIYNYLGQNITSPIFRINLFLNDGTYLNITSLLVPIEFEMTIISSVSGNNKCWYYNEKVKALRLDGVETVVINSNRVKCRVYHLTDFTTAPQSVSPSLSVAKSTRVIGSTSKVHVSGANINVMSWLTIILCSLISVLLR
ncbi:hypothetical protein ABK040_009967 [Willaertia magna]